MNLLLIIAYVSLWVTFVLAPSYERWVMLPIIAFSLALLVVEIQYNYRYLLGRIFKAFKYPWFVRYLLYGWTVSILFIISLHVEWAVFPGASIIFVGIFSGIFLNMVIQLPISRNQ